MLAAIQAAGPVVSWGALRREFKDLKRLRKVLQGLVRNGELEQDDQGNYLLGDAGREMCCLLYTSPSPRD